MTPSLLKTSPFTSKEVVDGDDYKMEALQRAAKERLEIVNKYSRGVDSDGEEDHWEDSGFKVYKVTDRYGFLHKDELSAIPSIEEERRKLTEVKRQYKWVKMIQKWKAYEGTEKLRNRVGKGIPLNMRGDAWRLMLNVEHHMKKDPTAYEEMKKRSEVHSPDIKQIDMDVNRTYRNHIMFRKRYSIKQQQLFHVLAAYSMYNTEVGYCQGMSQIAALLLMYMSEEEAFWALHSLLYGKRHRMHGFFIPGFPKLIRFQDHHDKILKKFIPRLKKHLDKNEIFASLYTMKWFFQCFLDRSPFPLTLRLWDMYVLEGEKVLIAMSYTTLKMHKTAMKKMEMDEIVAFLQERLAVNFGSDDDAVVEQLRLNMIELKRAKMDLPPSPGDDEAAKLPFGLPVKPSFEQETGIRVPNKISGANSLSSKTSSQEKQKIGNGGKDGEANGSVPVTSDEVHSSTDTKNASSPNEEKSNPDRKSKHAKASNRGGRGDTRREPSDSNAQRDSKSSLNTGNNIKDKTKSSKGKQRSERRSQYEEERNSFTADGDEVFLGENKPSIRNKSQQNSNHDPVQGKNNRRSKGLSHNVSESTAPMLKKTQTPSSMDHVSSAESSQPHGDKHNRLSSHENEKVKLVWKTPNPAKVIPSSPHFSTFHQNLSSSSPVSPQDSTWSDEAILRSPNTNRDTTSPRGDETYRDPQSDRHLNYGSRAPLRTEDRDRGVGRHVVSSTVNSQKPHGKKSSKNKTFTFDPLRPYSVYDNVNDSAFTESDDDVIADSSIPMMMTSPTGSSTTGNVYEAKMEESLENLRELAAGLSRTPSPRTQRVHVNSPRKQLSPLVGYKPFDPISMADERKKRSSRPKSVEVIDTDNGTDDMGMSPLDHGARRFSKSVDVLENKKKTPSTSAFRKAVEGAGITQLPKPPSSVALNENLGKHFSYSWQVPEHNNNAASSIKPSQYANPATDNFSFSQQPKQEAMKQRYPVRWVESNLDHPNSPTYNYPLERQADMEMQPIKVNFSRREQNENNNSRIGNRKQTSKSASQLHGGDTVQPSRQGLSSNQQHTHGRKSSLTFYSRHGVSDLKLEDVSADAYQRIDVTRYDGSSRGMAASRSQPLSSAVYNQPSWEHPPSGDAFVDITRCSPDHSPRVLRHHAPKSSQHVTIGHPRSTEHFRATPHSVAINDRELKAASPAYAATKSRFHQYVVPDNEAESLTLSNSSWSHTKRKNSSSIAVQTEQSPYLSKGSFI